jgi:RNA polymerase sigma-70 factor (ECF subfamily)
VEGRPPVERELALQAQRGDPHAFESLVDGHREVAFRLAVVITGSAAEAEDAAQDALVKAWRALPRFRVDEPFRPWLLRIVANEARNRRRSLGRRTRLHERAAVGSSGDAAPSPEELTVAADEHDRLLRELRSLPDEARLILTCRYLLELSEAETAAALGVRPGTVKSRTARALDRLRAIHE